MTVEASPSDEPGVATFEAGRPRLLGLAYRILGTFADAEDVVQEVWLRWQMADRGAIERPEAWLTTVTSRAALDRLRARQRRREEYVGPWLPEPIRVEAVPGASPEDHAVLADTLTLGFLTVLERLEPVERVVFLLAEVFGEPYAAISEAVGRSEVACRQIASRARRRVRDEHRGRAGPPDQGMAAELAAAVVAGDLERTLALLDPDVVLTSDGGANRRAARKPVVTAPRVARFLINIARRYADAGVLAQPALVNGEAALVLGPFERPFLAMVVETGPGVVRALRLVVNPDKLHHLAEPISLV